MIQTNVTEGLQLNVSVQWVEEMDELGEPVNMDIYFDRVVMVCNKTSQTVISTGILIDNERILTSYNPYRKIIKDYKTQDLVVGVLTGRQMVNDTFYKHRIEYHEIDCHNQVIDMTNKALTSEQWHGNDNQHSSVHDLLILRISKKLKLLDPDPQQYSFGSISDLQFTETGPMITELAELKDWLGDAMKFASLGYKDKKHITKSSKLSTFGYEEGTNVVADCDEWIIRDWGRVICISNEEKFLGIASGSLLVYKDKLFGIGSFTLNKGNVSIFVFSDVRAYHQEIFSVCASESSTDTTESSSELNQVIKTTQEPEDFKVTPF